MKKYIYKYSVKLIETQNDEIITCKDIDFKTYKKAYNYLKKYKDKYSVNIRFVNNRRFEDKVIDLYLSDALDYTNHYQRYSIYLYLFKERFKNIIINNKKLYSSFKEIL